MKIKLLAVIVVLGICQIQSSLALTTINWANGINIKDVNGVDLSASSNWIMRLYKDNDFSIGFSFGSPGAGEVWTGYEATWSDKAYLDGLFSDVINSPGSYGLGDSNKVYTVLFNGPGSALPTVTKYSILDNTTAFELYNATGIVDYDPLLGGTQGAWLDMVPEPGTWAFMGIGFLTIAYRRLRKA